MDSTVHRMNYVLGNMNYCDDHHCTGHRYNRLLCSCGHSTYCHDRDAYNKATLAHTLDVLAQKVGVTIEV